MPRYQLRYLNQVGVMEVIDVHDPDEAEDLARLRLLFHEPGFAIAIVANGRELRRIVQQPHSDHSRP